MRGHARRREFAGVSSEWHISRYNTHSVISLTEWSLDRKYVKR
jgi:hypothetical protein